MTRFPRTIVCFAAIGALAISGFLQRWLAKTEPAGSLDDPLYISSPTVVRDLSLGYSGLVADVYWTRVVQYFGAKHHMRPSSYDLLAPLLDITTTLDPHLLVAYEFGSTYLAQAPPEGAGKPALAVKLLRRGIEQNPRAWRLYYLMGFLDYLELHDPKAAADAFETGSKLPDAHPLMRVMAAKMATAAGDPATSVMLWTDLYQTTEDTTLKRNALRHLAALKVDRDVVQLEEFVHIYANRTGSDPQRVSDLVDAGLLRGVPLDPLGNPYKIVAGRVEVADPDDLPFITKGLPPGRQSVQHFSPELPDKELNTEELFASKASKER